MPRMTPGKKAKPGPHDAREELKKPEGNRTGNLIPHFSKKAMPGLDVYPLDRKGNPKKNLCPGKDFKGGHEVDMQFAGWAKGYGDGTFDVSCRLCGEIGSTKIDLSNGDVRW